MLGVGRDLERSSRPSQLVSDKGRRTLMNSLLWKGWDPAVHMLSRHKTHLRGIKGNALMHKQEVITSCSEGGIC